MQKKESIKYCNKCGKEILVKYDAAYHEGAVLQVEWGYFTSKDGEKHTFCLCEECYDNMISGFRIPVVVKHKTELV